VSVKGAGPYRSARSKAPSMSDARAKGAGGRGGQTLQELYFRLSAASAEDSRLREQSEALRAKERRVLKRLENTGRQMAQLRASIDSLEAASNSQPGKQPNERDFGSRAWDVTELRY